MNTSKQNCNAMKLRLADLLLDPAAAPAKVREHVAECDGCRGELEEMQATMAVLDAWEAPEPSPYFMTRLGARMREEREAEPAGWLTRVRARLMYGPGANVRPLAALALTIVLFLGGGTYLGVTDWTQPPQATNDAAVVHDLQTLENNAQVLDTLEALSSNDNGD